jgi:hypothetical protein
VRAPLLVFTEGTPAEVIDPDNDRLTEDVELAFGIAREAEYHIDFSSRRGTSGPGREGMPPPYLGFEVMIPVYNIHTMAAEAEEEWACKVEHQTGAERKLTVYAGTVTLRAEQAYYRRTRRVEECEVVVGRSACRKVLLALKAKTRGPQRSQIPQLDLA